MAGFTGVFGEEVTHADSIKRAAACTVYASHTKINMLHSDTNLVVHKSYVDFLETNDTGASIDGVTAWVDGEIYNTHEFESNGSFIEVLLSHYAAKSLDQFLQKLDGIFIILIYDTREKRLLLISDRYGLRPFYLSTKGGRLTFAPEVKCFGVIESFEVSVRKDVVDCFIELEHFLGNVTWLDGVALIKPASVYTYALPEGKLRMHHYWSWSNIKPTAVSFDDAAQQIGSLLDQANKKRFFGAYPVGVGLSGGLDSRAILAAVHLNHPVTYTFGLPDSQDVLVAKQVAEHAGVKHVYFDIRAEDWLADRFAGVWKTDGMLNMYHMHYSHLMDRIRQLMAVNLSGFLGDVVLGGSYMNKKGKLFVNKRPDQSTAYFYYGRYAEFCDPADSFFDIEKVDPYVMYNRGRRMIGMGAEEANKTIPQRLPFMDVNLMDFAYSLPDDFRVNSKVYDKALLIRYPEFYRTLPNASTGVPIHDHPSVLLNVKEKYYKVKEMIRYKMGMATSYTDVNNWIKEPAAAKRIGQLLDVDQAIYPNFTSRNFKREFLEPHLQGKANYRKQIMGALTFEIWLQQLLNKKFIPAIH